MSTLKVNTIQSFTAADALTVDDTLVISGSVQSTGPVTASSYLSLGVGTPVLTSTSNISLKAQNGGEVIITTSSLRLASFANSETGSMTFFTGSMYFNTTTLKFMGYNGTSHVQLG